MSGKDPADGPHGPEPDGGTRPEAEETATATAPETVAPAEAAGAAAQDRVAPEEPPLHPQEDLDFLEEEEHGSGLAGTLLVILVTALAAGAGALWAAPKLAPHLPGPIATYLVAAPPALESDVTALIERMDAQEEVVDARLGAIESRLDSLEQTVEAATLGGTLPTTVAALSQRVEAAETISAAASESTQRMAVRVSAAAETASAAAKRATVAEQRAAGALERTEAAGNAIADAERRLDEIETRLASARQEMRNVTDALAAPPPEDAEAGGRRLDAAVRSLRARIDGIEALRIGQPTYVTREEARDLASQSALSAATTDLAARAGALAAEIDALRREAAATRAELSGDIATLSRRVTRNAATKSEAVAAAEAALSTAALEGSRAALTARLLAGAPYAEALANFAQITGAEPPEPLTDAASEGHSPLADLRRRLGAARDAAVSAQIDAEIAARGPVGRLSAWARRQLTGSPPADGAVPGVIQSFERMDAYLDRGNAAAALAEANGLPEPARVAAAGWIGDLAGRVEAERALAAYLAGAAAIR